MRKFVFLVFLSVMLGFAIALLVPFDNITAATCPASMTSVSVGVDPALASVDRNGNGTVCMTAAGQYVDDNIRGGTKKKAPPKKKN